MGVLFDGVIHVAGEQDTGKTMFAFSCGAQPEDIAFVDDDIKGVAVVEQIRSQNKGLGYYCNLVEKSYLMTELDFHKAGLEIISDLEKLVKTRGKKFEALIWDTWTRFEDSFHPWIVTYPQQFRKYWSPNGTIKGAEQWNESFKYEAQVINRLQGVARMVILTTHLKPENIAGRKTGKNIPAAKKTLEQKSLLRVYLRHNNDGPEPVGLILKRVSRQIVTDSGIDIVSILPRKMKPFTWERIRYYWDNPVGSRSLEDDEKPNEFELSILDGTLTEDQKEIMRMQDNPPAVVEEETVISDEIAAKMDMLKSEGKSNPIIAREVGLKVPEVVHYFLNK
jgi:hypothetical protein